MGAPLSPHRVLPVPAARRARAEKGACVCNHQVRGHTCPPQGTCMTGGHRSHLPSTGHAQCSHLLSPRRAQWSWVTPSLPRACTVLTLSLARACTVVRGHTFSPQGVHSGHRSHVSPGRLHAEWLPAGQEGSCVQCPLPPERGHGAGATGRLLSSRRFTELPSGLHSSLQTSVHCPA